MGQWIFGRGTSLSISDKGKKLLKSSGCIVSDFVGDSTPDKAGPILCTFEAVPVAFWDVSTLNRMIFSRALWEKLLSNDYLRRTMEDGSHFGESAHADRDEVYLKEVACRVNKFWMGDRNLVLGNVDIMNTPNGNIVYTLAKTSRVGISSRGFGELRDRDDGLKDVVPDEYMHVCFDMVAFPAVPDASMTLRTGEDALSSIEMEKMSGDLRGLIEQAYDKNPENKPLQKLYNSIGGVKKKSFDFTMVNALNTALISQRVRFGYKDLFSQGKRAIISMAKGSSSLGDVIRRFCRYLKQYLGRERAIRIFSGERGDFFVTVVLSNGKNLCFILIKTLYKVDISISFARSVRKLPSLSALNEALAKEVVEAYDAGK